MGHPAAGRGRFGAATSGSGKRPGRGVPEKLEGRKSGERGRQHAQAGRKGASAPGGAEEASRFLNLSKSYLYKLTSGNLIPHYKPQGKMLYFERAELEAWLRRNPVKTQAQIEAEAQQYLLGRSSKKK